MDNFASELIVVVYFDYNTSNVLLCKNSINERERWKERGEQLQILSVYR